MEEPAPYSLSGALSVQDDLDDEQLDRVSRHLSGIASVYVKHDAVAHTVSLCISGTLMRDDARYIEQRIERFAEEHARADLPPANRASRSLVKFVFGEEDEHEEALYGTANHRVSEGSRGRYAGQGTVQEARVQ
ncbi:hypothetical protein A8F30_23110 [Burkholderia cenocepacia]|nr:hypothetical protein A8F30_23110 [Burkholderia cenocepacia]